MIVTWVLVSEKVKNQKQANLIYMLVVKLLQKYALNISPKYPSKNSLFGSYLFTNMLFGYL